MRIEATLLRRQPRSQYLLLFFLVFNRTQMNKEIWGFYRQKWAENHQRENKQARKRTNWTHSHSFITWRMMDRAGSTEIGWNWFREVREASDRQGHLQEEHDASCDKGTLDHRTNVSEQGGMMGDGGSNRNLTFELRSDSTPVGELYCLLFSFITMFYLLWMRMVAEKPRKQIQKK